MTCCSTLREAADMLLHQQLSAAAYVTCCVTLCDATDLRCGQRDSRYTSVDSVHLRGIHGTPAWIQCISQGFTVHQCGFSAFERDSRYHTAHLVDSTLSHHESSAFYRAQTMMGCSTSALTGSVDPYVHANAYVYDYANASFPLLGAEK